MGCPKVSIIVPVYETAPHLGACIESLVSQTFPSIECLLVDDASPDNSAEIIQKFSKRDSRVINITNPTNLGTFNTRRIGFLHSKGDYIATVDSDDWVDPAYIENLVTVIERDNADIAGCLAFEVRDDKPLTIFKHTRSPMSTYVGDLVNSLIVTGHPRFNIWNKLYRRCVWQRAAYCAPDVRVLVAEDFLWSLHLYEFATTYSHVDACLYYYRRHGRSNWGRLDPSRAVTMIHGLCDMLNNAVGFLESRGRSVLIPKLGSSTICENAMTKLLQTYSADPQSDINALLGHMLRSCPYLADFIEDVRRNTPTTN